MRKVKVSVVCCEKEFITYSLIPTVLKYISNIEFIEEFRKADLVICGPFSFFESLGIMNKLIFRSRLRTNQEWAGKNIRNKYDPDKKQIWLHYSGESPSIGKNSSFLNSGCDFGIGHEILTYKEYFRMPLWYSSLGWEHEGIERTIGSFTRFGQPIKISKIMSGITNKEWSNRNFSCALVSSHTRSPRDVILNSLSNFMPVETYGLQGPGAYQFRSKTTKLDIYSRHALALCPENQAYPGYVTEKVLDAFAGGCLAIGWYHTAQKDFLAESHINLFSGDEDFSIDKISAVIDKKICLIRSEGIGPLLDQKPSLDALKYFLLNVISACR